jgi:acyl-lipid omega-6 desaturase (Delta-12 desaturase)
MAATASTVQVATAAAMPSRKTVLLPFERSGYLRPFLALAIDVAVFSAGLAMVLMDSALWLKLIGSVLITAGIVRLFLIGHDACHVGHNVAHHGFNNLKGRDQVWAPMSKEEFDALPAYRKALERIYRSGCGWGLYYFLELWWKKLYFATKRQIGSTRAQYKWDSMLVTLGMAGWVALVALVAYETGQSFWLLLLLGVVLPFALWNAIMGFVVFVHHTHPDIAWFTKRQEWQRYRAYLTSTVHVRFPFGIDRLMHNIMEHNAHHVNPRIPMYKLRGAQKALQERFAGEFSAYKLDWRGYLDVVRRCKLYDYVNHAWLDYRGQVTSRVTLVGPTVAS